MVVKEGALLLGKGNEEGVGSSVIPEYEGGGDLDKLGDIGRVIVADKFEAYC